MVMNTQLYRFSFKKCENSTSNNNHCKSEEEINAKMAQQFIYVAALKTYFDYDDYENPIKSYVDDEDVVLMIQNYTSTLEIQVQQNHAYLADNLFFNFLFFHD